MKRIVILDKLEGERTQFRYAAIAVVPAARRPRYVDAVSVIPDLTQAEKDAFASGTVTEKIDTISVEPGVTIPQIQSMLQARAMEYQAEVNAHNPWLRLGTYWDDATGWTPVNNA